MATLDELSNRYRDLNHFNKGDIKNLIEEIDEIQGETGWEIKDIINLYKIKASERLTACYIDNGDNHDIQIYAVIEEIRKSNELLQDLIEKIK